MRTTFTIFLLLVDAIPCGAADRVTRDLKDENTLVRLQVLSASKFNLRDMGAVAHQFLATAAKTHSTAVLSLYADRTVAAQEAAGCEGNYLQWKLLYDDFPKTELLAANVISLQGDAVLWLRTLDRNILRRVLSGKDPTQIAVAGVPLEILFVKARIRSQFEGCGISGSLDPVIYLKTGADLTSGLCERVTSWLATRLGAKHIWVEFANIPWFPCEARFPLRYPFSLPEPLVSEDTFYRHPALSCTIGCDGKPKCLGPTRWPPTRRPRAY